MKMTTPSKSAIVEKAIELWRTNRLRANQPYDITPEESELREEGFLITAQQELLRDRYKSALEHDFIDFPNSFTVDLESLFDSNGLILGSRKSGKSDLGMLIAENAVKENAIIIVFDPSLDWIERSSIQQYVRVESPYAVLDVPSENTIFDLGTLSPSEQQRIVESFSKRLFEHQVSSEFRKQYLVIFEESHTYFFQGSMRSKNAANSVRLLSVGRNVNIACLLISQFACTLDKFTVRHSISQVWCGFSRELNDLKYLKSLLGSEAVEQLPKLNNGEFLYLSRKGLEKIQINPFECKTEKTEIRSYASEKQVEIEVEKPKENLALGYTLLFLLALGWLLLFVVVLR